MPLLSTNDLAAMKAQHAALMPDTCIIQTFTEAAANSYNEKVVSYTDGPAIDCGYSPGGGREYDRATGTIGVKSASVRMALTNTVTEKDKIKITYLKSEALSTALTCAVADVNRSTSILVVALKAVA